MTTSEPRSEGGGIFEWLSAQLLAGTWARIIAVGILAVISRLGGIATVWCLASESVATTFVIVFASAAAIVLVQRVVTARVRTSLECELRLGAARAMLDADVLEEPSIEPHLALGEGIHSATTLVDVLPSLVADSAGALVAVVVLLRLMTVRGFAGILGLTTFVAATTMLSRARTERFLERSARAQRELGETFATLVDARFDVVANGEETAAASALQQSARRYEDEARRSAVGLALLGRGPTIVAIALSATLLVVIGDLSIAGVREHPRTMAMLGVTLSLVLGVIANVQALQRARTKLRPFAQIVLRVPRAEKLRRATDSSTGDDRAIDFDGIRFGYRAGAPVLDTTRTWPGGLLVLRGSNGAGKSTALRLMAGLRDPQDGSVHVGRRDVRQLDLDRWRSQLAFLPQRPYLGEPHETVAAVFRLVAPRASPAEVITALERVGIRGSVDRTIGVLSIGQRQRVAIARVLARKAELLLLDEPDANLDAEGIDRLVTIIEEEVTAGKMVAIAAHGPIAERLRGTVWDL